MKQKAVYELRETSEMTLYDAQLKEGHYPVHGGPPWAVKIATTSAEFHLIIFGKRI